MALNTLNKAQLRESLHINEEPGQLTFQTWFGIKIALRNEFIAIKPALAYSQDFNEMFLFIIRVSG